MKARYAVGILSVLALAGVIFAFTGEDDDAAPPPKSGGDCDPGDPSCGQPAKPKAEGDCENGDPGCGGEPAKPPCNTGDPECGQPAKPMAEGDCNAGDPSCEQPAKPQDAKLEPLPDPISTPAKKQ